MRIVYNPHFYGISAYPEVDSIQLALHYMQPELRSAYPRLNSAYPLFDQILLMACGSCLLGRGSLWNVRWRSLCHPTTTKTTTKIKTKTKTCMSTTIVVIIFPKPHGKQKIGSCMQARAEKKTIRVSRKLHGRPGHDADSAG